MMKHSEPSRRTILKSLSIAAVAGSVLRAPDLSAIAVLPFADMSPSRDQDYLCEGLAEELINALTHVDGPPGGVPDSLFSISCRRLQAASWATCIPWIWA